MLGHGAFVFRIAAHGQQPTVNFRLQGFHPSVHDFGEAGIIGNLDDRHACALQGLGGAAGRQNLDIKPFQGTGQLNETGLVGNRYQRAADRQVGHNDLQNEAAPDAFRRAGGRAPQDDRPG
jgi:hypothetical protein